MTVAYSTKSDLESVMCRDANSTKGLHFVNFIGTMLHRLEMYHENVDNVDSACKDAASLLHNIGKTGEDILSIDTRMKTLKWNRQYQSLLSHLKSLSGKAVTPLSSRVVYVEVPPVRGRSTYDSLRRIFPNVQKIWRVIMSKRNCSCLIEFASHSSARRAVDARQNSNDSFPKCTWVSPTVEIPPMTISQETSFPIIQYIDDDSIIVPSTDWRRPRPTGVSEKDEFCRFDLTNFLIHTGAFDDYPPDFVTV